MREKERRPQAPFGPSVASLCHPWFTTTNLSYRFPIFETSATALCGTTGKMIWKQFLYNFMVLLNGPVKNALFCLMDRYQNVCVWFMARNCRSQRLELTVANVGTTGYHCKELPVPRGWNSWFPTWEPWVAIASNCRLPEVGTHASQPGNHRLPLQRTSSS